MYKALKNFAHVGKTYLVGDNVPTAVAKVMDATYTEAPEKATTSTTKHTPTNIGTDVPNEGE